MAISSFILKAEYPTYLLLPSTPLIQKLSVWLQSRMVHQRQRQPSLVTQALTTQAQIMQADAALDLPELRREEVLRLRMPRVGPDVGKLDQTLFGRLLQSCTACYKVKEKSSP